MDSLVPLLLFLTCPVGMGLIMWLMMHGQTDQTATSRPLPTATVAAARPSPAGWCLNGKVLAGLTAIGLTVWIVAPSLAGILLPLLLLAACPLSMLLMMRGMAGGRCADEAAPQAAALATARTRAEQVAALKAERLRSRYGTRPLATLSSSSKPARGPRRRSMPTTSLNRWHVADATEEASSTR